MDNNQKQYSANTNMSAAAARNAGAVASSVKQNVDVAGQNAGATKTTQPAKTKTKTKALVTAGAVSMAVAAGAGGFVAGSVTTQSQDVQDFEPNYTVSQQVLNSTKSNLQSLKVRSDTINIPDYDSSTMPKWNDADGNGCSTREDILIRDFLDEKTDESGCKIKSGTMFDYYNGTLVKYNRLSSGGGIDIDHIVAKGNAWISGGYVWSDDQWKEYVNDADVLIATSASTNRSKADKDASLWLPPNEDYLLYVRR